MSAREPQEVHPFTFVGPHSGRPPGDFTAYVTPADAPDYEPKKDLSALVYAEYSDLIPAVEMESPVQQSAPKVTLSTRSRNPLPIPKEPNQMNLDDL